MKFLLGIFLAGGVLVASAYVLLHTEEAPLAVVHQEAPPPVPAEMPKPKSLSTEEFRGLAAEAVKALPLREDGWEPGRPLPLFQAAESLRPVNDALKSSPELVDEGMLLYKDCANSRRYSEMVMALCFFYMHELAKSSGKGLPRYAAPPEIKALAEKLGR
jgi:hypothetical protein